MVETGKGHNDWHRWPANKIIRLKELWTRLSASQIAPLLGVSRNAVIGKANRLHLGQKKQPGSRKPYERRFAAIPMPSPASEEPTPVMQQLPFLNRTIDSVGFRECRYPDGENVPYRFCGQPVVGFDGSYCAYHSRIVYHPVSPRRPDLYRPLSEWRGVR